MNLFKEKYGLKALLRYFSLKIFGILSEDILPLVIHFQSITKKYGSQILFRDLSFTVQSGEIVAITGASGAGKSTILHMMLGAEVPDAGNIEIDGFDISHLQKSKCQLLRRSIGVIFQDFKLLPAKNVFENISYAMEVCDQSEESIQKRVPEVLRRVNLVGIDNKFPDQLSGGEKQRVAIARALVHKPKLLIADEPTGNLDLKNGIGVADILKKINSEDGITVIVATHHRDLVKHLRPRVIRLSHGDVLRER
jgi:cell division transport system ATP-binding protein